MALVVWAMSLMVSSSAHAASEVTRDRLTVRIEGVVAEVALEQSLRLSNFTTDAAGRKAVVELNLPRDAEVMHAGVTVLGRAAVQEPGTEPRPIIRSGSLSLIIERAFPEQTAQLSLRYRAPLACVDGRLVLPMPPNPNPDPVVSPVKISARLGQGQSIDWLRSGDKTIKGARAGATVLETTTSGRAPWEIVLQPQLGRERVAFSAGTLVATRQGTRTWLGVCRPRGLPDSAFPSRLVVLVDRSNSVSPAGLSLERDAVLQLIQALPTDVRVEIAFFSRKTTTLFPVARLPTTQFLRAFSDAMVPSELGNGTGLRDGLLRALDGLAREPEDAESAGAPWLWVVTDGALDDGHTADALREVSDRLSAQQVKVGLWIVRPRGDAPIAARHASVLQTLLGKTIGVFRMSYGSIESTLVSEWVTALRQGGDWLNVNVQVDGVGVTVSPLLAPGAGMVMERVGAPGRHFMAGSLNNQSVRIPIPMAHLPLSTPSPRSEKRAADSRWPEVRFRLVPEEAPAETPVDAGSLDRSVVRHGLSMAYLPRARSCYLNRKNADTSRFLAGKVRMGLHFERGELLGAEVMSSDLERPDIEACLRESAFALQVPRPMGDDFPVLAIVNLVFRPVTPQQNGTNSPELEAQLDIVLGEPGPLDRPTSN